MAFGSTTADILARSIESSSDSERALGAKAAQSCLDLRTWLREIEGWTWPGSFDVPQVVRKSMRREDGRWTSEDGEEYWGSLPAKTVRAYEQRADEIGQLLDEMDVEELKDYVLSSHYRANSRPPSRARRLSTMSTLDLVTSDMKRLDDFTALVTATILQALPFQSHLHRLLDVWTTRLIVLRTAPQYLRDLERARADLDQAWTAISASLTTTGARSINVPVDRQAVSEMKSSFEYQVGSLGRKLDRFLDDLEGREDRVPDSWIDDFENLESAYGSWVAQADRRVLENEWRLSKDTQSVRAIAQDNEPISELEAPFSDADTVRRLSVDTSLSSDPFANFDQTGGVIQRSLSPSLDAIPIPVLQKDNLSPQSESSNPRSISERLTLGVEEPSSHRSVSESAAPDEGGGGLVAKRRAAFLNDIERTNSLKLASKSPVRSFEHASNAFTKLFKKDRSPEKARPVPKRSGSSRSGLSGQLNASVVAASLSSPSSDASAQESMEKSRSESVTEFEGFPATSRSSEISGEGTSSDTSPAQHSSIAHASSPAPPEPVYQVRDAVGSGHSGPETYKPSRLSSPFASPNKAQVPEDWPLNDRTDSTFDQDLQQQHDDALTSNIVESANAVQSPDLELVDKEEVPTKPSSIKEQENIEPAPSLTTNLHDETGSPTVPLQTDVFDRMFVETLPQSSPETPGSVDAPERSPPWTGSRRRHSLPRHQRGNTLLRRSSISSSYLDNEYMSRFPTADERSIATSPASLKVLQPEHDERRASATSIETFPRSQLKSINVSRPSSSSLGRPRPYSEPTASNESSQGLNVEPTSETGAEAITVSPPRQSQRANIDDHATPHSTPHMPLDFQIGEASPAPDAESESPLQSAPLNAIVSKRRGMNAANDENKAPMYTISPVSPSKKTQSRQGEDSFDRHVSEVLNALPAPIRFRSRPGAETPVHQHRTGEGRVSLGPRPKQAPTSRAPSRTSMVIAPAESSPKKSSSASDPEVKLYHLTQAGRDEPIKLFVRLVGEGERVMVRVGGGWSDLADYLRQYAEHHGSRTVSDSGLEMQTALNSHSRRVSGPVELKARPAPATPVPESGRATPLRPWSRDSENDWSEQRPGSSGLRDMTNASPFAARAQTPTLHGMNTLSSTPKSSSASGSSNSRPSTSNGAGGPGCSRPSSRQSTVADGHGLAGPSSTGKRGMLPDHKAKWVDSMIERAKASAEKNKEGTAKEKYFGELGKAGGTRRLVFRSGSGSGVVEKK